MPRTQLSDTVIVAVCSSVSARFSLSACLVHLCLYLCSCHSLYVSIAVRIFAVFVHLSVSLFIFLCLSLYVSLGIFLSLCVKSVHQVPNLLCVLRCLPVYVHPSLSLSLSQHPPPTSQVTVPLFYNCPRYLTTPYVCLLASRSSLGHVITTIWHRAGSLSPPRELVLGRWCPLGGTGPPHDQSHTRASSTQVPNTSYQTDSEKVPHASHNTVSTCCSSHP